MSDSAITVADCRQILGGIVSDEAFLSFLNQAMERLILSGKWKGNLITTRFSSADGYIVLPRQFISVAAATFNRCPMPTFSRWHHYVEVGPGQPINDDCGRGKLVDMGETCTQVLVDAANAGPLIFTSSSPDNGLVVRVFGLDLNGNEITDPDGNAGEAVTLASPSVTTSKSFSRITGLQSPRRKNRLLLSVQGSSSTYQVGEYDPTETRPLYRMYRTGTTDKVIEVLCQRRYVPVYDETDWVHPGNLGALRNELMALYNENQGDMNLYSIYHQNALNLLNDEARAYRGGERGPPMGQVNGIRSYTTSTH